VATGRAKTLLTGVVVVPLALLAGSCARPNADWMSAGVGEPTVFASGVISTGDREYGIAFTPDGSEAYFTRRGRRGPSRIFVSRFVDGAWSDPEPAAFSREGDEAPYISPDGDTMLFSSRRRMSGSRDRSENIWMARRHGDGWSELRPLPGTVNQPGMEIDDYDVGTELGPTLLPGGQLMYWTRTSPDWGSDIYVAEPAEDGRWINPRPLLLNSPRDERNATLSPDGRYLIFEGYRSSDGFGGEDLYVSERTDYGWRAPRLLPEPVNSDDSDTHPGFSPDGRFFFFASDRGRRYSDIYYVDVDALGLDIELP
jgi:Tol biopolymer transport system component